MAESFLLDSNTCIRFINGQSKLVEARLHATTPYRIKLCSVVKAELLYGVARSRKPATNLARLEAFLSPYESFPFDDAAAKEYGRIRGDLAAKGTPIGPNDLMIAAIALSRRLILVTHNVSEFSRVAGLRIEDWEVE